MSVLSIQLFSPPQPQLYTQRTLQLTILPVPGPLSRDFPGGNKSRTWYTQAVALINIFETLKSYSSSCLRSIPVSLHVVSLLHVEN